MTDDCVRWIKDGHVWCETHDTPHTHTFKQEDWDLHRTHRLVNVKLRHVCYTGTRCLDCPDAPLLMDSDQ